MKVLKNTIDDGYFVDFVPSHQPFIFITKASLCTWHMKILHYYYHHHDENEKNEASEREEDKCWKKEDNHLKALSVGERERKIEEDDHFSIIYILACKLVIWTISVILQCYRNTLAFFTKIFKLHPTYSHNLILLQRIIVMMTLKDKHFFLHT